MPMKIILPGLLIIGLVAFGLTKLDVVNFSNSKELLNPYVSSVSAPQSTFAATPTPSPSSQKIAAINGEYEAIFQKYQDKYPELVISVDVINITQNKQYKFNSDQINVGASTTKLFTASSFLSQLEKGKYDYDLKMGSYNAKFQLQQMVTQSNNNSWELFYTLLGRQNIEKYVHDLGSKDFKISDNTVKAGDMTNYLSKLYKNQLHSKETTDYLLSLMQKTNEETFIPKSVAGFTIYHKNGQLEEVVNEAVLAVGKDSTYAIAIYTDGKDKWEYEKRRVLFKDLITDILKN
jgi:beta-lactamase class A